MRILFDSSFVIPLFGIEVDLGSEFMPRLRELWKSGVEGIDLLISNISLIECLYLLNREYRTTNKLDVLQRYETVIATISHADTFELIDSLTSPAIIGHANRIRSLGHTDYLDCLIFGTAQARADIMVTRERDMVKLLELSSYPVKMMNWQEFAEKYL